MSYPYKYIKLLLQKNVQLLRILTNRRVGEFFQKMKIEILNEFVPSIVNALYILFTHIF